MNFASMLNQRALYFEADGVDATGNRTYKSFVKIRCRWETSQTVAVNENGEETTCDAKVFTVKQLVSGSQVVLCHREDLTQDELDNPALLGLTVHNSSPLLSMGGENIGFFSNLTSKSAHLYS